MSKVERACPYESRRGHWIWDERPHVISRLNAVGQYLPFAPGTYMLVYAVTPNEADFYNECQDEGEWDCAFHICTKDYWELSPKERKVYCDLLKELNLKTRAEQTVPGGGR